jgi:hypothetical protein
MRAVPMTSILCGSKTPRLASWITQQNGLARNARTNRFPYGFNAFSAAVTL